MESRQEKSKTASSKYRNPGASPTKFGLPAFSKPLLPFHKKEEPRGAADFVHVLQRLEKVDEDGSAVLLGPLPEPDLSAESTPTGGWCQMK